MLVAELDKETLLAEAITEIYLIHETWHKHKLSKELADRYHKNLIAKGNILTYIENNELLGYAEFWRINYEQFGRILCMEPFHAETENTTDGNIAYLANIWVSPEYRKGITFKALKMQFFAINYMCKHFVGERRTKKAQLVKVFKREDILKEEQNG